MYPAQPRSDQTSAEARPSALLLAGDFRLRAAISHSAQREDVQIMPVASVGEITMREFTSVDVLLTWDEGDAIGQLRNHTQIIGTWIPIVAIGASPTAQRVVRALVNGAVDYVDWTGDLQPVIRAIVDARVARERYLPLKQRQLEAGNLLQGLSRRERQVLLGVSGGATNKEIARTLNISPRTVEIHRANMLRKLKARHSADAVRMLVESAISSEWLYSSNCAASWAVNEPLLSHLDCRRG